MVFNIVIVSVLVILIIHYSIDYLKTFLNPCPPILEDLKYKKYKTMIDEISRPRPLSNALSDDTDLDNGILTVGDLDKALSDDTDLGNTLLDDTDLVSEDLGQYFNSKIAEE